nr:AAA family ATPase [Actinomycetales bacterium]
MTMDSEVREIELEQRHLDRVYARLDEMRAGYLKNLENVRREGSTGTHQNRSERDAFAAHYEDMIARLDQVENRLVFGRLDFADATEPRYIGRIGILSDEQEQLLQDWRAPSARPFYQATAAHPGNVVRRRHLTTEVRQVVDIEDELLNSDAISAEVATSLTGEGALFAALAAAREGQMGDIVATIQSEQDAIIRDSMDGILVVQGGPGTGKTAVVLHRAAYLLYAHRERLQRSGVLIVGPTRVFLDYIDQVLPSLGESDVVSTTVGDLLPGTSTRLRDPEDVAAVKGNLEMANVMERAVRALQRVPETTQRITVEGVPVEVRPEAVQRAMSRARRSASTHNESRSPFVLAMLEDLVRQYAAGRGLDEEDDYNYLYEDVRAHREVRIALNLCWMPTTPHGLLERLYSRPDLLERHAPKLTRAERTLLQRESGAPWTISDIPLLDELAELLGPHEEAESRRARFEDEAQAREQLEYAQQAIDAQGLGGGLVSASMLAARFRAEGPRLTLAERAADDRTWTYGHVVVDEAQELSPMAWRSLLRRVPLRSMTVVGDLAQQSSSTPAPTWRSLMGKAGREHVRQAALTVSYRTPSTVLDAAGRVLMAGAPADYLPLTAARDVENALAETRGHWREVLVTVVRQELADIARGKMAVIAPTDQVGGVISELAAEFADQLRSPDGHPLRAPLVVLDAPGSKGLEFDVVVVVEP